MTKTVEAEAGIGKTKEALIIVDPGFRRFSMRIGEIIGGQLTQRGIKGLDVIGKGKFLLRTRREAKVTKQVRQLLEALND